MKILSEIGIFLHTGNLLLISGLYIGLLIVAFLLYLLRVKEKSNSHLLEVSVNLLLTVCIVIGALVFNKLYLLRIFIGAFMLLFSIFLFMKFNNITKYSGTGT